MTSNESLNSLILLTSQNGGARNLVAIQMQNGKDSTITNRVQKANAFPGALKWRGLCLTIPNDSSNDYIRIVEGCTKAMRKDVTQFASFVNGAWSGKANMARDTSRC